MDGLTDEFELGDSVAVENGVEHPDLDYDISGWQGRVIDVDTGDEPFGTLIGVEWDSLTLQNMPRDLIEDADQAGIDWTQAYLLPEALLPVQPRDSEEDVTRVSTALSQRYETAGYEGEESATEREARTQRTAQLLSGIDEKGSLQRWADYLYENLQFPFNVTVATFLEQGPMQQGDRGQVEAISLVDDSHGIIVRIAHDGDEYDLPLATLEVDAETSVNHQLVTDYSFWWDAREGTE